MMEVLSYRLIFRINIEGVLSEFSRYTRHVRRFPCKNVPILMDELDERDFLFGIHIRPNGELLGWITRSEFYLLGISG
jgi:hypothetical protein